MLLKEQIQAFAEDASMENQERLQALFLEAKLLVPTPQEPEEVGERAYGAGDEIELVVVQGENETKAVVAFSHETALLAWEPEGCGYLALEGAALLSLAQENRFHTLILDPAGPHRVEIQVPSAVPAGAALQLRLPDQAPSAAFLELLVGALKDETQVEAAFLFELTVDAGEPCETLGVAFSDYTTDVEVEDVFERVSKALELENENTFQLVKAEAELLAHLESSIPVIYRKTLL